MIRKCGAGHFTSSSLPSRPNSAGSCPPAASSKSCKKKLRVNWYSCLILDRDLIMAYRSVPRWATGYSSSLSTSKSLRMVCVLSSSSASCTGRRELESKLIGWWNSWLKFVNRWRHASSQCIHHNYVICSYDLSWCLVGEGQWQWRHHKVTLFQKTKPLWPYSFRH